MNRETIYLDELITKIRENKEIGEIMGSVMMGIAKSCKTVQQEEMPHYKQIRRDEVMPKLLEDKRIYCAALNGGKYGQTIYKLRFQTIYAVLDMIKIEDAVFYERIEGSEG